MSKKGLLTLQPVGLTLVAMRIAMVFAAAVLSSCVSAAAANGEDGGNERLPGFVIPTSYKIFVEPDPERSKFSGSESIRIEVGRPVSQILLNSAQLKICGVELQSEGSSGCVKPTVSYHPKVEQVEFKLPGEIKPGHYTITMSFDGTLNAKSKGFFRTSFKDSDGHKRWLVATQMEATDARRMFPCFDEPQFKATFAISASIGANDSAVSNAPLVEEKPDAKNKRKLVTFGETPKMSTYLVALVAGPLVHTEATTVAGVPIRIWCTPGKQSLAPFSQALAGKVLTYYEQYFDCAYPAKKLDLIAVPDFDTGAMENLGAIIFREDNLLIDERKGSIDAKEFVALTVAHEMAHQWFGDLVTMKWWDDIWLNESFADWMSTKAVDKLHPEWHFWNEFALEREEAMLSDSLNATRPIHFDCSNPDQIDQMFDEITYEKGASVLRMLEEYVGETTFRDGIRHYMNCHLFGNATTADLWEAISEQFGTNVSDIVRSWIYKEGFPVVTVNDSTPPLVISQKRFSFEGDDHQGKDPVWEIPVAVRSLESSDRSAHTVLMTDKDTMLSVSGPAPYVVNAGGNGYFRVRYNSDGLRNIAANIDKLTASERAAVLSDQMYLAVSGQLPVREFLDFTGAYRNEEDPAVTSVLCADLEQLNLLIEESACPALAAFVRDRLAGAKSAGWSFAKDDSDLVKRQRARVLLMLGTFGEDKETIEEARALAKKYAVNGNAVDAELIDPMVKIVAYNGGPQDFEFIESLWQNAKTPECQTTILMALGIFQDPALLERTMKMCLTDKVRRQDAPDLMAEIMETRAGRDIALRFFQKHIIRIAWRFPALMIRKIVIGMNSLATEQQLAEVKAFFNKHPVPSQSRSIQKIIEAIDVRVTFRQRSGAELSAWLLKNAKRDSSHPQLSASAL